MIQHIQNFETLAVNDERRDALSIAEAGYTAINIGTALKQTLKVDDTSLKVNEATYTITGKNIFFIGIGKCAFAAADAIEEILGDRLISGIALDVNQTRKDVSSKIERCVGTHPLPSKVNERATKHILEFLSKRTADDFIIMLISGGGSTLLCSPETPMNYVDEGVLWNELTKHGAEIKDINTVRKHISHARGGGLVAAAYPATTLSLIVSDVPGNDIEYIASGPTVLDSSTIADAQAVLTKFNIMLSNINFIKTPKEQKYFERVTNLLFLTNKDALIAMQDEAERLGYTATIKSDHFAGEAREMGTSIAETLHTMPHKSVLLYAGESTVTLGKNAGMGGRNQEMALAVLELLNSDEIILPFSSDGRDNTDHAGAIADITTREHAEVLKLTIKEYLSEHRSYDFFKTTKDALQTGYTGSNVSDLIIAIKN